MKLSRRRGRARVLVFIDLVQDIDTLLPVLAAMRDDADLEPRVVVSRWLARESPRTEALLTRHRLGFSWVRRAEVIAGRAPGLRGQAAVLSAAESSHPAHAAAHALAARAEAGGLAAFTLQHGLENVGLNGPEANHRFASSRVFCWFPSGAIPPETPADTRPKLSHVGRPMMDAPAPAPPTYEVGVFENLHADRYTAGDRQTFRAGVEALAREGVRTLVRPHPAGGWSNGLAGFARLHSSLTVQSAAALRGQVSGVSTAVMQCRRVITTPSTVALDALQLNRPVSLAVRGGPAYAGLPVLEGPEEWLAFAASSMDSAPDMRPFLAARVMEGDATPRILAQIKADLRARKG
ncbi:MAG TPA: hypothetical protein VF559_06480 [Caulobacteraceae bacterium]